MGVKNKSCKYIRWVGAQYLSEMGIRKGKYKNWEMQKCENREI